MTVRARKLAVAVTMAVLLAACGGDKDEQAGSTSAGSSTTRPGSAATNTGAGGLETGAAGGAGGGGTGRPGTENGGGADGVDPDVSPGELPGTPLSPGAEGEGTLGERPQVATPTTIYVPPKGALDVCQVVPVAEVAAASGFALETATGKIEGNRGECRYEKPGAEAVVVAVEDHGSPGAAIRASRPNTLKIEMLKDVGYSAISFKEGDVDVQLRNDSFLMYVSVFSEIPKADQDAKAIEVAKKAIPLVDAAYG